MDGVEFIRCLRADPVTAGIPILAASGDTHLAGAADAVLEKPYDDRRVGPGLAAIWHPGATDLERLGSRLIMCGVIPAGG